MWQWDADSKKSPAHAGRGSQRILYPGWHGRAVLNAAKAGEMGFYALRIKEEKGVLPRYDTQKQVELCNYLHAAVRVADELLPLHQRSLGWLHPAVPTLQQRAPC